MIGSQQPRDRDGKFGPVSRSAPATGLPPVTDDAAACARIRAGDLDEETARQFCDPETQSLQVRAAMAAKAPPRFARFAGQDPHPVIRMMVRRRLGDTSADPEAQRVEDELGQW